MYIPPRKEEGSYAYSLRVIEMLWLFRGLRCLARLVIFISMFKLMIMFASCFPMGKAHGWVTFPKYSAGNHLALGP